MEKKYKDPYKLMYHISPIKGLLNDPNGLIRYKNEYYVFHQWNRFGVDHSYKEWGLFKSSDLIHWENFQSALIPDMEFDKDGVYSGSAVEDQDKMYLFYTGNVKQGNKRKSYQCLATTVDGRKFLKYGRVVETPENFTEHFRDPKVWRGLNCWWMVVGGQTLENEGAIAIFDSKDLYEWRYRGILFDKNMDQMCECPDLFPLDNSTHVLLVCPQKRNLIDDENISSYSAYLIGNFNEENGKFVANSNELQLLDYGFDFYAPQTFIDHLNRRIMMGWMSNMDDQEEKLFPTRENNYLHSLTIPRELFLKGNKVCQRPIEELKQLRRRSYQVNTSLPNIMLDTPQFEINIKYDERSRKNFSIQIQDNAISLSYMSKEGLFCLERESWSTGQRQKKFCCINTIEKISILGESSSLEVFVNDGEYVFTSRYISPQMTNIIAFEGLEDARVNYYVLDAMEGI